MSISPDIAARKKALEGVFSQINDRHGKGSVMLLGDSTTAAVEVIPSGSLQVDHALGAGGYPRGRIVEIFGPEASGKTTVALQAVAQAQKRGGACAFVDAEHALDPAYASKLGVDIKSLVISQPDYGEQALDIVEMLVRSNALDIIVLDSVAALVPKAELDGEMGDTHVGLQARLMSQALRKLTPIVHKSKTVLIFINQIRHNINAMAFASKEVTTGGNALKFYASIRLDVRRIESLKDKSGLQYGNRVQIKVVKNKIAPPFRVALVTLLFGEGISREFDIIDAGIIAGVISQSGSWFSFDGKKLAQGRDGVALLLKGDAKLQEQIIERIRSVYNVGLPVADVAVAANEHEESV